MPLCRGNKLCSLQQFKNSTFYWPMRSRISFTSNVITLKVKHIRKCFTRFPPKSRSSYLALMYTKHLHHIVGEKVFIKKCWQIQSQFWCSAVLIFVKESLCRLVTPATSFLNCACSFSVTGTPVDINVSDHNSHGSRPGGSCILTDIFCLLPEGLPTAMKQRHKHNVLCWNCFYFLSAAETML